MMLVMMRIPVLNQHSLNISLCKLAAAPKSKTWLGTWWWGLAAWWTQIVKLRRLNDLQILRWPVIPMTIGLFPPRLSWNHPQRSQISIVSNRGRTDFWDRHRVAKKWHCRCAMKSHDGFQGKPTGHIRFGEKNRGFRQRWWWSWPFHIHPNFQSSPNIRGWYRWYP